jgi:Tetracyclin repressor-like, C-terminal domain
VKRGELPRGSDPSLVIDVLFATVQHDVLALGGPCDDQRIARLVDLVLVGAQHGGARPPKRVARARPAAGRRAVRPRPR